MNQAFPWEQVSALLDSTMELPPAERLRFLEKACPDASLRDYLRQMILSYEESDFLESPPLLPPAAPPRPHVGRNIGPYHLIDELGEGGMGVVYRAVRADDHYLKSAAIKLMKGDFSSSFSIMRFRVERQILASLEHPNIARLLDGGATEEGTPYLVMELIEGSPLDEYCDSRRLPLNDRLRLFRQACSAVQYAHQHLVIHRDLKPKNILVTERGEVKLLDFGIAKILDPESFPQVVEATSPLMRLLSPEYASPEQVLGGQVSTASDIYSLGVVLYLLLTGKPPYSIGSGNIAELTEAICHTEPPRPSVAVTQKSSTARPGLAPPAKAEDPPSKTPEEIARLRNETPARLARHLEGDLDNIVLKALRKDPERRYSSVEQLSEDVRRYLDGLPVTARPDTLRYRTRKFMRRHRALAISAAAVAACLLIALLITLHEAHIARLQRAEAERRLHDVRDLARSNLVDVHNALEHLPGSASARHIAIQRSLKYLDEMNSELRNDLELMREVSDAYEKVGDLQGAYRGESIGDSRAAQTSYAKAFELRSRIITLPGSNLDDQAKRLGVLRRYTRCLVLNGNTAEAWKMAQMALSSAVDLARLRPGDPDTAAALAAAHFWLSIVSGGVGSSDSLRRLDQAIEHDRIHVNMFEDLSRTHAVGRDMVRRSEVLLALHLSKARQFAESAQVLRSAIAAEEKADQPDHSGLTDFYNTLGLIYEREGRQREALDAYKKSWPYAREAALADPQDLDAQIGMQIAEAHLGMQALRLSHQASGLDRLGVAVGTAERMQQADPGHVFYLALLVVGYSYQGEALSLLGDHDGALARYARAQDAAQRIAATDPNDFESRLSIAKLHLATGVLKTRQSRFAEARSEFEQARSHFAAILAQRSADAEAAYYSIKAGEYLAAVAPCRDGAPCAQHKELALPSLLN